MREARRPIHRKATTHIDPLQISGLSKFYASAFVAHVRAIMGA